MEYTQLISISGMPGLFELVGSKSGGAIVKSLEDGTTKFVSSRIHNISQIESIEVFTTGENVNLVEVFIAMDKSKEKLPELKDEKAVKEYFKKSFPEMDFDKVYFSDMKKMVKWFSILKTAKIELKLMNEEKEEEESEVEILVEEPIKEKAILSKAKQKKTAKEN